jgi:hypothetical protein
VRRNTRVKAEPPSAARLPSIDEEQRRKPGGPGVLAIFIFLVVKGVDLATATDASDTAKTLGTTLVGAAVGMVGATAVGAGTAVVKK